MGAFGYGWSSYYSRHIYVAMTGSGAAAYTAILSRPDGKIEYFSAPSSSAATWTSDPRTTDRLVGSGSGWILYDSNKIIESYDSSGKLTSVSDYAGFTQTLTYDASGRVQAVSDSSGRVLSFSYDPSGRIITATTPGGAVYGYAYDSSGNLASVTEPSTSGGSSQVTLRYIYDNTSYPNALTGITDEAGGRYAAWVYDANGWAIDEYFGDHVNEYKFIYSDYSTSVTDPLGDSRTFSHGLYFGVYYVSGITGGPCATCGPAETDFDVNGYPVSRSDFNGNITATTYDPHGLKNQEVDAQGQPTQRTINTTWDTTLRNPLGRTVLDASGNAVAMTQWVYNPRGQVLARCEIDPARASSYTCATSGTPPAGVRRWLYTYCDVVDGQCPLIGLLLTVDGPRADVSDITQYSYYVTTDESGCGTVGGACHRAGDPYQVTDALGHTRSYLAYDKDGGVTRTRDANGIITDYAYAPRGWLTQRIVRANADGSASPQDAVTTIEYNAVGNVSKITDPDGVYASYTYDNAHRLTDITDALGNYIHYTLDAAGDRTREDTYDSTGTLRRTLSRTYNTLGQLTQQLDAQGRATLFAYDVNGNVTDVTDPLGTVTHSDYDGLNRLVSAIQDFQGANTATQNTTTSYTYDSLDQLTQVTDPDGLVTTYTIDSLGNTTAQASPDTGTAISTYDAAGNRISGADARGVVTNYSYDALNRLTSVSYPSDATLNVSYTYDEPDSTTGCGGSYPLGRLTRITDSSGSTTFCYDLRGNVVSKRQVIGGATYTTLYGYTLGDRLASLTYPSGAQVLYGRDGDGRITSVDVKPTPGGATTGIISGIGYLPFGPATAYTFATGGQVLAKTYDQNYWLTDVTSNALNLHFTRDADGNITALGDAPGANPASELYSDDPLQRLTQFMATADGTGQSYTYDKTGDRLSKTILGGSSVTYGYLSGTHRLGSIGSEVRSYDAAGNTTAANDPTGMPLSFTYDARGRMTQVQLAGTPVAAYQLDGLGERVQKTATFPTSDSRGFVYGSVGQLLGEYSASNQREYVYADGVLVAALDNPSAGFVVSYIHTDGLGTPRAVTVPAGTTIWRWDYQGNAFGEQLANQDPDSDGTPFILNLRFPGQYWDAETGLAYNVHRTYDASVGRYLESDPLGLNAGVSTYSYAFNSALLQSDPMGLEVTTVCRPIEDPWVQWAGILHCAVFVWHWMTDECGIKRRVVDSQFSIAGGEKAQTDPTLPTYRADRDAFNNPGNGTLEYDDPAPLGLTKNDWDAAVTNAGTHYNSASPYNAMLGPNSNTAAHDIIQQAGGIPPDISWAPQYHYSDYANPSAPYGGFWP